MDSFMKKALSLAKRADPFPNPRVGAVLVKDGEIIGEGYHRAAGQPHAEIEAIQNAKRKTGNPHAARSATLYVTLEPCSHTMKRTPPCTKAIIAEGIGRVIYAMKDPNPLVSGARELREAGVEVRGQIGESEAMAMNKRYIANIRKRPFVAIKMAMSADGKTATRTGDSKWITGSMAREYVHRMRGAFDAVMVGAGTVIKDDPQLTTHGKGLDPYRIIIDGRLSIPLNSRILKNRDGKTLIVAGEKAPREKIEKIRKMRSTAFVCCLEEIDMKKLILGLSAMGIKKILIEGGSGLNAKAVEAGIVDRLYFFVAPKIIGGRDAKPVIGGQGIERMREALRLKGMKVKKIGDDFLIEAGIIR